MSSNEEYLDSLLLSLTGEEESENAGSWLDEGISMQTESDAEEQSWDGISSDALEQMLANVENLNIDDATQANSMRGVFDNLADEVTRIAEEKAFSDPGALFFEGEEEDEFDDEPPLVIQDIPEDYDESEQADFGIEDFSGVMDGDAESISADTTVEEDLIAMADSTGEYNVDGMDELNIENADDSLEAGFAVDTDSTEEDLIALADGTEEAGEEDLIALVDGIEESMEENLTSDANIDAAGMEVNEAEMSADAGEEDLMALVGGMDELSAENTSEAMPEDEGFKEISDLLASSSEGDDDMFAMLEGVEGDEVGNDIGFFDIEEEQPEEEQSPEQKKKKEKKKQKKAKADSFDEKTKKQGLFARFIEFLLEEDDDEEEEGSKKKDAGDDSELLGETTDENGAILEELDKEDAAKKKDKTDKKGKKKKGKKGKDAEEESEDGEESEESAEGKKKKKKEKKEKKKKADTESLPVEPSKKLSVKKIEITVVFCLTILAGILLIIQLVPPAMEKSRARDAYYAKDYERVLEGFYGEKLSESDSIMYNRAYIILRMQRKIDAYNNYMYMGKETDALNQLIEGILRYNEIYEDAMEYNVVPELDSMYQTIMDALQNKYGLSVSEAVEIYAMEDDLAYTLKLESIINGTEYVAPVSETEEAETEEATQE